MQKLIDAYKANPTEANRQRLIKYMKKHMMAGCLLSMADQAILIKVEKGE